MPPDEHSAQRRVRVEARAARGGFHFHETVMVMPANQPATSVPAKCEACDRPVDHPLICGSCRTLHRPDGLSHFEMFGLPQQYEVDAAQIRRRYLELLRDVHPDHARHPDRAADTVRTSAALNEAYQVLSDPLARAEYLLELSGGPTAAEDKTVPAEILARTLMLQEEIEEERAAGDGAALEALAGRIRAEFEVVRMEAAEIARRLPGNESEHRALRAKLNTVRYFERLIEAATRAPAGVHG